MTKKDPIDCIACRAGVPLITDTSRISSEAKLKTIDNERDAQETIRRLKAKP